jgi:hypothetical protein
MAFIARRVSQTPKVRSIGTNRENLKIAFVLSDENDEIPLRRPEWEVVVLGREGSYRVVLQVHNPQALALRPCSPEYEPFSVGRH